MVAEKNVDRHTRFMFSKYRLSDSSFWMIIASVKQCLKAERRFSILTFCLSVSWSIDYRVHLLTYEGHIFPHYAQRYIFKIISIIKNMSHVIANNYHPKVCLKKWRLDLENPFSGFGRIFCISWLTMMSSIFLSSLTTCSLHILFASFVLFHSPQFFF